MDSVGRVESATEAGFQNDDVDLGRGKMLQGERGCDFEKRRMRVPARDQRANSGQSRGRLVFRNHFAVYADAFAEGNEVRGGEEAGAMTLRARDRIDHGADRAFAIRPRDVNDPRIAEIDMQRLDQPINIFETKFDPK